MSASRAGFVVLVGLPNAGKSTLLNAILGEHLSIVTPKAQTTWQRVAGILTEGGGRGVEAARRLTAEADAGAEGGEDQPGGGAGEHSSPVQMILVDTPGIVTGPQLFHRSMLHEAERAIADGDVTVVVADGAARRWDGSASNALRRLAESAPGPVVVAANKADRDDFRLRAAGELAARLGAPLMPVSARAGTGVPELLDAIRTRLPEGPFLYPDDEIATAPTRFFVQELIRETVFERYRQEIPYSVAVRVEEFREAEDPVYIAASLHVERKSQKGLLIGRGGTAIRELGRHSRTRVERFLGRRAYLELWVKVTKGWRRRRAGLAMFGYRAPDDDG